MLSSPSSSTSSLTRKSSELPVYGTASMERQFPLYGGAHSVQFTSYYAVPAAQNSFAADRQISRAPRRCRSSFALSDIFESGVEIEISPILPPSPSRDRRSSLDSHTRPPRLAAALSTVFKSFRTKKNKTNLS